MVEQLANLGLPSAFVGMILIALIFKPTHQKVSLAAAITAVCLVGVYGVIQLAEAFSGGDVTITVPSGAQAFDSTGPVSLDIAVSRRDTVLTTATIAQPSPANFDNGLRNLGWSPAVECLNTTGMPAFWSTNRVHAGQTQRVGQTAFGLLRISARQFTGAGEAIVALELAGSGQPVPSQLAIRNKGLKVQSFSGIPEFFVALREADFQATPAWAAFTIFTR